MGDASAVRVAIAEEATFGVNPAAGFNFMRFNSESLRYDQQQIQSGQIDPTRQPSANIRVAVNASGGMVCEDSLIAPAASPGNGFDRLIEGAMMNDWPTDLALTSQDIDITGVSGGTFDLSDTLLGGAFTNVSVGDWIKLSGFSVNGTIYARVKTKTDADNISCEGVRSSGAAVTNEAAGGTVISVTGSTLKIGSTKKSYTIERQYTDLTTPEYSLYLGMRVSRWQLSMTPQAIFQHSFDFLGKSQGTTTSSGAGSPAAVWATPALEAVDHFKMKMLDSFEALSSERISRIDFQIDNRLRQEPELGVLGSQDIGISTPIVSGTIVVYMKNADLIRLTEAGTRSKIAFRQDDGTRQRIIGFNSVLFGTPEQGARGNDQSVEVSLPFTVEQDSDNVAMTVSRF